LTRARLELCGVLVVAAVLRLAVLLAAAGSPQRYWSRDDREYLGIAHHLHASYLASSGRWFDQGLRRTPVYPLFLRGVFDVFGNHYVAVVAVQLVLSVATVAITYLLAGLILPRRYALAAAAALAVDPASIVFSNQMLTETLFALLLTGAMGLIVLARQRDRVAIAAVGGGLLGIAVLTRPVAEYLPFVIAVACVAASTARRRSALGVAAAMVLGFALSAGAWVARNEVETGVPIVSTIDGYNMLQYRAVGALVEDGEARNLAQHDVLVRLAPHLHPGENAAKVSRAELRVGLAILADHPVGAVKSWARGEAKLLLGPGRQETALLLTGSESVRGPALRRLVVVEYLITIVIVLAGALGILGLLTGRIRAPELWLLAAAAVYLITVSGGPEAYSRFRVPVTPLFVVLGAAALAEAAHARKEP
jgi:4-amino-4-deoxy-L-arabinose transferase-like glycosyltransferase